jgi:predicted dehydrogenase
VSSRIWRGALIGCGFFAPNHLHGWAATVRARIVALCDVDAGKSKALGAAFKIGAVYTDVVQLLAREDIDFVDVVTPPATHRGLVERAAMSGKAVVCQKPLADSLEDADAMVSVCRKFKVPLLVHENFRWQRPFLEIARLIREGAIGRAQSLRLSFRHDYSEKYRNQPYLASIERLALMDVGVHLFDLARVCMGKVSSLHCRTQRLNPAVRGEDSFIASCRHADAGTSLIDCSFFARGGADLFPQTLALIEGTRGKLQLLPGYQLVHYRIEENGSVTQRHIDVEPPVPAWGAKPWHVIQDSAMSFQHHVIDVLDGRTEPQPSGADNRETLALALAAYESARHDIVILNAREEPT